MTLSLTLRGLLALMLLLRTAQAVAGDLPDPALTPGIARPELTLEQILRDQMGP